MAKSVMRLNLRNIPAEPRGHVGRWVVIVMMIRVIIHLILLTFIFLFFVITSTILVEEVFSSSALLIKEVLFEVLHILGVEIIATIHDVPEDIRDTAELIEAVTMHECIMDVVCRARFEPEVLFAFVVLFVGIALPPRCSLIIHRISFLVNDLNAVFHL